MNDQADYNLFHQFIAKYAFNGFVEINRNDSFMLELEAMMEKNNQFFILADLLQMNILYTSQSSVAMIGITPEAISPNVFFAITHPNDFERFSQGRIQLLKQAQNLYKSKAGNAFTSTNLKIRNPKNKYSSLLFQCFLFYASTPIETVYSLNIYTNIDQFKSVEKHFHYYSGDDLTFFRYPDEMLLQVGSIYTKRELEIIKLIDKGLCTNKIAENLFLSHCTVNAHRANILKKSNRTNMYELIHDLNENGLL
ncbi:LuxR C-terminal-related transcriptional regulator [Flavobacterium nackdongense]|uniref:HTH luxR-type domain-containing protein n=1 Tax=Flavobacterium nackdongense TaxID=2547394 RepID=A0A4P6Y615_9FLAO|nr:LuxR C-terminal-related transcriptional regulator [Flavobacterium nackdongense]QBN17699.1 hypothetical protein E1750_02400 [Flavobacterium nackdongense]